MKKQYIIPTIVKVELKTESLLVNLSNAEADKSAVTLSRDDEGDWEDEY